MGKLNNEPCMNRPTIIDLSPIELNYYPLMTSLGKCNGSCDVLDDLSAKICVPSKIKDGSIKIFNTITRINQVKALIKHISWDCK